MSSPKKRVTNRTDLLWQFLLELLIDERYENTISWTNRVSWEFRINDINELARLWKDKKNLRKMNSNNLYRSMTLYYKTVEFNGKPIFTKTADDRYCFRFTEDIDLLIKSRKKWCRLFKKKVNNLV